MKTKLTKYNGEHKDTCLGKKRRNVADAFLSIFEALEEQRKVKRTKHKQDQGESLYSCCKYYAF